ncbi:MAG: EamA family transporter [Bryobacterales bacterium]|jgi:drug/metabolite transporter (DMT)-like permease|nr:EamA family transporter [Bryobacterales bacterium]
MRWLLVSGVVLSTVACDLLQSWEMKRHSGLRRQVFGRWPILLSVFFMAASFFCFLELLKREDLSFAVPATAASLVLETLLARVLLKEVVQPARWAGAILVAGGVVLLSK